jgi:putative phosphoesterase
MSHFIAIVSDTHGNETSTRSAVRLIEPFAPLAVLHCGDIGSEEIPALFKGLPTHFVFGNVDLGYEAVLTKAIRDAKLTCANRFGTITVMERKIAWLHGDDTKLLRQTMTSGEYDLVCSGHTHVYDERKINKTLILNPGALQRATPHTCAVVELETMSVTRLIVE